MTIIAFSSAEAGDQLGGGDGVDSNSGVWQGIDAAGGGANIISTSSPLTGNRSWIIDPVAAASDRYGIFHTRNDPTNNYVTKGLFMWEFQTPATFYDRAISLMELHHDATVDQLVRRLILRSSGTDTLALQDKDEDQVGSDGSTDLQVDIGTSTTIRLLYFWDFPSAAVSRDIVWLWNGSSWNKEIDATNHGDHSNAGKLGAARFVIGTRFGKGAAATTGDPFKLDEVAVQDLNTSPNDTALGSIECHFLAANGNGDDGEWTDQAFGDVDEIPPDQVAIDTADGDGLKNSYEVAAAGEAALAVIVSGSCKNTGSANTDVTHRGYITRDGVTRDTGPTGSETRRAYSPIGNQELNYAIFNDFNGDAITSTILDDLQAGIELVDQAAGGDTLELDQIGLEYCLEGPIALPSDFPTGTLGTGVDEQAIMGII